MITSDQVLRLLSQIAGREITLQDPVLVLGSDSLDLLSAFEQLERWTELVIPDPVMVEFKTINDVVEWVESHHGRNSNLSGTVE